MVGLYFLGQPQFQLHAPQKVLCWHEEIIVTSFTTKELEKKL